MSHSSFLVAESPALCGEVVVRGAKNAILPLMASSLLGNGVSRLKNVPASSDVFAMAELLESLGAVVSFDMQLGILEIDTRQVSRTSIAPDLMQKMRASSLLIGPLLVRDGHVEIVQPGGCTIGKRPLDWHFRSFEKMGATILQKADSFDVRASQLKPFNSILEYPSVGVTENILMAAVLTPGVTRIANAALEPEVFDLISSLQKRGACITVQAPMTIVVEGVESLQPLEHEVLGDRLEAGTLLLAAAATKGSIVVKNVPVNDMELFLEKLCEMGHTISRCSSTISFTAHENPRAVSFRTMPHPGFPTDLQAPMMAALCLAEGTSTIYETVFENRFLHVTELQKMGAKVEVQGMKAQVKGVDKLLGAEVAGTDIRATAGLIIAGLSAQGVTTVSGLSYLRRGYADLENQIRLLGGNINSGSQSCLEEIKAARLLNQLTRA